MEGEDKDVQKKKVWEETAEESRKRFVMELEFVQCLSNPLYIQRERAHWWCCGITLC